MRLVLDTNVLIAAFVSRGHCFDLLEHVARAHELYTSDYILAEFRVELAGKFRVPEPMIDSAISVQRSRSTVVEPALLEAPVCRDPDDDPVLGTAIAADANALITGDQDLLELGAFRWIAIISPGGFWAFEAKRK